MATHCKPDSLDFGSVEGRAIGAGFDGGEITSDGGALLLAKTEKAVRVITRFATAFKDGRNPDLIEHEVETMVGQRVIAQALGYADINDHDQLRHDPLLAAIMGKLTARNERCAPLAGKSTLNRLEHSPDRYHKISHDTAVIDQVMLDVFRESYAAPPKIIVLDPDASDIPLHGHQEGRHYHGFYDGYCYLPPYIFCDRHILAARLRPANTDAAAGIVEELSRIVACIRKHWPETTIVVRADSGFCRDNLMTWCEENDVHFVLGLAQNERLVATIQSELAEAEKEANATGHAARRFKDFEYRTHGSWSAERRVVAKAEWTGGEANPRFIPDQVRDHLDACRFDRRAGAPRGVLLQARRDGEPHQRDANGHVRRPHAGDDDARQPASDVFLRDRLRADVRAAADRARRHDPGAGDLRHDPNADAEDRCTGDGIGAAGEDRTGDELSVSRLVQRSARALVSRRGLTGPGRPRINHRATLPHLPTPPRRQRRRLAGA